MNQVAVATVLDLLDPKVWVLTAQAGPRRGGLVTTSVVSASIVPELPRLIVTIARQHYTWELIEQSGAFALHLLAEESLDWVWRFGLATGRDTDKLAGLEVRPGASGSPILAEAPSWLDCRVEARLATGDRTVFLAEVLDGAAPPPFAPLSMRRLLELAPAEKRKALKESLVRDAALDGPAIQAWRQRR